MRRLVVLSLLCSVVFIAFPAFSQHRSCYTYQFPVQQVQHTCAPVQQTYTPEYQYPVQKVIAQDIAIAPLIITVPVDSKAVPVHAYGNPYYYSVSNAYQEKAYIREMIRDELRAFTGQVQQQQRVYPPQQQNAPSAITQQEQEVLDDVTPADLQQKLLTAYNGKGNCLSCHGNGQASGKFRLTNEAGQLLKKSSDKRWKIYGMASVGAMPPAAASDSQKAMEAANLPTLLQYAAIK